MHPDHEQCVHPGPSGFVVTESLCVFRRASSNRSLYPHMRPKVIQISTIFLRTGLPVYVRNCCRVVIQMRRILLDLVNGNGSSVLVVVFAQLTTSS